MKSPVKWGDFLFICLSIHTFPPSGPASQASQAQPGWLSLKPGRLGLRPCWIAPRGEWTDGWTNNILLTKGIFMKCKRAIRRTQQVIESLICNWNKFEPNNDAFKWMNEWMNKWINEWMHECMNEWMNEWVNNWVEQFRPISAKFKKCMADGWMDRWMDWWTNKQVNGQMDR